jgi:uncharacterized protein (TIGR03089 family)
MQSDVWGLLSQVKSPEQPFVTVIDQGGIGSGRIELSCTTLINGASKAANGLVDILDIEPGWCAQIDLGWTWQQSVWQAAAWMSGLQVSRTLDEPCDVVIDSSKISMHPLGLPQPDSGPSDLTAEVLGQPDAWMYPNFHAEQAALIEDALHWAHNHGITHGDRVGVETDVASNLSDEHFYLPLLVPLVVGGSVVFAPRVSSQLKEQEQITRVLPAK